jgi:microcystin-dependent protein
MTVSYLLAPIPKWVLINNEGTVAGGATLYTYRSLNKTQEKIVYQDAGGTIPYTNPIVFDLNGTSGPFYWSVDSADLSDTYYLEAYDSDGNLLWTLDDYFPPGSGGGGGNVTTYVPLKNYIANNQFIDNIISSSNPTNTTNLVVCPSNHVGFTPATNGQQIIGTYGVLGPDIRFVKNNTNATDVITFENFALGTSPLTGDVTPVQYLRYQCTNSPAGETYKAFQFPICQKVNNLANQAMTFSIWAKAASAKTLTLYARQYFGSGTAASAEVRTALDTLSLTTAWTLFNISLTIPSVAGKSLGTPGLQTDDDALYIQLQMPLGVSCDIQFTKPALYLGTINPNLTFQDYDDINSVTQVPRVGEIKTMASVDAPYGWLFLNDQTIGNVGSVSNVAQTRMFQLYKTLWDSFDNAYCPVSGGRGASAVADFLAGKNIQLPYALGRVIGNSGNGVAGSGLTSRPLGEHLGTETISISDMPSHNHLPIAPQLNFVGAVSGGVSGFTLGNEFNFTQAAATGSTGGSAADGKMQPTTFLNMFIKW